MSAEDQQEIVKEASLTPSSSMPSLPAIETLPARAVSAGERTQWEAEKQNLYQQLDDKVIIRLFVSPGKVIGRDSSVGKSSASHAADLGSNLVGA